MSAGRPNRDLSRILHNDNHVGVGCRTCQYIDGPFTKSRAISTARRHALATGHDLTLWIMHWQTVRAPRDGREG